MGAVGVLGVVAGEPVGGVFCGKWLTKSGMGGKLRQKLKGKGKKLKKRNFNHEETKRHEERGFLTLIDTD